MTEHARSTIAVGAVAVSSYLLFAFTPLDPYTGLALAAVGVALLAVPRRSIRESLRRLGRRTGVGWGWWAVTVVAFLGVVNATGWLGAPEVFVRCTPGGRDALCPTGYGVGTFLVGVGSLMVVLAAGFGRRYRQLRRHPPDLDADGDRVTVAGRLEQRGQPLETPVAGADALWYTCEVDERNPERFLADSWLPVSSDDRSGRCSVTDARGRRLHLELENVALVPTFIDANVGYAETVVGPSDSPPDVPGVDPAGSPGDPDRSASRRYREWYVSPGDVVVASVPATGATEDGAAGDGGGATLLAVGRDYADLRATLGVRTAFVGGPGLVALLVGAAIVSLSV